jgi:hypothetical protein
MQKSYNDVWRDIIIYLAKNDITKIEQVKQLIIREICKFLLAKVQTIRIEKANNHTNIPKPNPIGYIKNLDK